MRKWLSIAIGCTILALLVFFGLARHERSMIRHDMEQTREALGRVNSFHFHYEGPNFLGNMPPMTQDVWVLCPDYRYEVTRIQGGDLKETIYFEGGYYARTPEKWVKVPGVPSMPTVKGCGTLNASYGLGVPFDLDEMLDSHTTIAVNNQPRTIAGDPCYDYTVTIPTGDVAKRSLIQNLCLNSDDHLPREVKFHGWGMDRDSVYTYDQWNKIEQPTFPEGFNPAML